MKFLVTAVGLLLCFSALTTKASILPPNHLDVYDDHVVKNITEKDFNEISDHIVAMWQPIAKLHGADLVVEKRWNDSTVNAYANQSGKTWKVTMFGGLARLAKKSHPMVSLSSSVTSSATISGDTSSMRAKRGLQAKVKLTTSLLTSAVIAFSEKPNSGTHDTEKGYPKSFKRIAMRFGRLKI